MIYLSGAKNAAIRDDLATGRIGLLQTPANAYNLGDVAVWAMDNGCFTETYPGDEAYLSLLRKHAPHADRCLFAAAPDVVGDAVATLERSGHMFAPIRALGYRAALVLQNGMESMALPWDDFDAVFVGGSTEWKLSLQAADLIREAKARGKFVHVGRVNSRTRYDRFAELGCDSADGTFLAFGPDTNAPKLRTWLRSPSRQIPMLRTALGGIA